MSWNALNLRSHGITACVLVLTAVGGLISAPRVAAAPPSAAQKKEANELDAEITKASKLFADGKFKESGDIIRAVQGRLDKFCETADAQAIKLVTPLMTRLTKAHALLELEGVELPALNKPVPGLTEEKPMPKPTPGTTPPAAAGGVSFVKSVAPILVGRCGACHVRDTKGMFSMADFNTLMKGPAEGVVVFAGDADGSRIIEVIESGDMPRSGGKVQPAELALLKNWIKEGAKFDGADGDKTTNLAMLSPNAKVDAPMMVAVAQATGKETVSFARDVAPHLSGTCFGCHGDNNNPRANFRLNNFTNLLKGGDSGAPVTPGKGADSLLIKKLKGTGSGQRMPVNNPPLADNVIAKIEKWIDEGARYDGGDAAMNLRQVAQLAKAAGATHEELAAERATLSDAKIRLALPEGKINKAETKNFLVLGNSGQGTIDDVAQKAEAIVPKVAAILKVADDKPLIKGRMTLFVLDKRYDYQEFNNMVERRSEIPDVLRGHFFASPVEVYGAFQVAKAGEYSNEAIVAQQLAGAYVSALGKNTPRWFSEGFARAVAARIDSDDARVAAWDEELLALINQPGARPDDFLTGKLSPENADIVAFSFVRYLMGEGRRWENLMANLKKGQDFTQSFSAAFGGSPAQLTAAWAPKAASAAKRSKK